MSEGKSVQSRGGLARAKALSPEERSAIASAAAKARWNDRPILDGLHAIVVEGLNEIDAALDLLTETRKKYRMLDKQLQVERSRPRPRVKATIGE